MRVRLRLFASFADLAGAGEDELELDEGASLCDLQAHLAARGSAWAVALPAAVWAVDRRLVQDDPTLEDGVEVAVMPPFSGG
jgi:molybdopterin converting factor small subunit